MYSYPFLEFSKFVAADVRSRLPANLKEVGYKSVIEAIFDLNWRAFSMVKSKTNYIVFKYINKILAKLTKIWSKISENVNKNNGIYSTFPKILNLDNSL